MLYEWKLHRMFVYTNIYIDVSYKVTNHRMCIAHKSCTLVPTIIAAILSKSFHARMHSIVKVSNVILWDVVPRLLHLCDQISNCCWLDEPGTVVQSYPIHVQLMKDLAILPARVTRQHLKEHVGLQLRYGDECVILLK